MVDGELRQYSQLDPYLPAYSKSFSHIKYARGHFVLKGLIGALHFTKICYNGQKMRQVSYFHRYKGYKHTRCAPNQSGGQAMLTQTPTKAWPCLG